MAEPQNNNIEAMLDTLLSPLAQTMIAQGVTIQQAYESLKKAMVKSALAKETRAITDSQISLMTGLNRKEIKRLRHESHVKEGPKANALAQVISYWSHAPQYQSGDGTPRDLPRTGTEQTPGIYELIKETRIDTAPGTVFQRLLDEGIVKPCADDLYHLVVTEFIPGKHDKMMLEAYQATVAPHLSAATHNLLSEGEEKRYYDRVLRYSHLSQKSVDKLEKAARNRAQKMLEELNRMAQRLQQNETGTNAQSRFVAGAYILPTHKQENHRDA